MTKNLFLLIHMQVFDDEKIIFIEVNKNFDYKGAMGSQLGLTERVGSIRGSLGPRLVR
jgi:hypothetical protein